MSAIESFKTAHGWLTKVLPLPKWERKDGLATFLRDRIDLRKTLSLCNGCLHKMPRNWQSLYSYEKVFGFYADDCGCDYCRETTSTSLFIAGEGSYHQEWEANHNQVAATVKRDRQNFDKDRRFFLG